MIKKMMYPKTKRLPDKEQYQITEKMDGSNLTIFKKDGELYVAQRNFIFKANEIDKSKAYPGLIDWLKKYGEKLEISLSENEAICCEWIGMGKIKYPEIFKDIRIFSFAVGHVTENFDLEYINYGIEQIQTRIIELGLKNVIYNVPWVAVRDVKPTIEFLDLLYENINCGLEYKLEGFIIYDKNRNSVEKYVRMKNGKLSEHVENVYSQKEQDV